MLFIPYAFYLYKFFPAERTFKTWFFTLDSNYFGSVRDFMYFFLSKFIPLILLVVWFTTCKHWWYHSIAIPIAVYVFQIIGIINDDAQLYDEMEFIYSLPFTLTILTILYFIRSKISLFLKAQDLKQQADDIIDSTQLHSGEADD